MRFIVPLVALAMPAVAWLSQRGVFGPDPATLSARYPTLLIAAGYAFAIWGLIFALDVAYAAWFALDRRDGGSPVERRIRRAARWATGGFAFSALWMIVFAQQWFGVALVVIWSALGCMLMAAHAVSGSRHAAPPLLAAALPLHAGWLSLAAMLNTAQVIVAYQWLPITDMLPWTGLLWLAAAALLLTVNPWLRAPAAYAGAALWGLAGVVVAQSQSALRGASESAGLAALLGIALLAQTVWLRRHGGPAGRTSHPHGRSFDDARLFK